MGCADPRTLRHYEPGANVSEIRTKPGAFFHDAKSGRLHVRTPGTRPPGVLMVSITNRNGIALENCAHITTRMDGYWKKKDSAIAERVKQNWAALEKNASGHPYSINWSPLFRHPGSGGGDGNKRTMGLHPDVPLSGRTLKELRAPGLE